MWRLCCAFSTRFVRGGRGGGAQGTDFSVSYIAGEGVELTVHNRPVGTNLKVRGHDMLWADTPPNLESLNSQTPLIRTLRGHRKCPY